MRTISLCAVTVLLTACARPSQAGPPPASFSVGTNLSGLADWSTELPFRDLFRSARAWISQREGAGWGQGPAVALDEQGWPTRLEPGCWVETPLLTAEHHPGGEFVCLYQGRGRIEFGNVAESREVQPGQIRVTVRPNQVVWLRLSETDPADPVRNIHFVAAADVAEWDVDPWDPAFLERWRGFTVLRFMDWMETNGSRIVEWDDRPKLDDAVWTTHGIPLERMVDLANRLGVPPWFCMPHRASDDYVRQFATYVRDELRNELPVYLEYSNELWNYGFEQTRWAAEQGRRLALSDNDHQAMLFYASRRSVEIFRLWSDVFGGSERLVRVMASQSANPWSAEQKLRFENAAAECDALAIAPYFGYQFGSPETADEVAGWGVDRLLDRCGEAVAGEVRQAVTANLAVVGNAEIVGDRPLALIAYEAGQHLVGHGGAENHEALMNLFIAANRSPRMGELYVQYVEQWRELGGGLLCNFSSVARPSKWGSWGVLESEYQDPATAPKYQALLRFVRR